MEILEKWKGFGSKQFFFRQNSAPKMPFDGQQLVNLHFRLPTKSVWVEGNRLEFVVPRRLYSTSISVGLMWAWKPHVSTFALFASRPRICQTKTEPAIDPKFRSWKPCDRSFGAGCLSPGLKASVAVLRAKFLHLKPRIFHANDNLTPGHRIKVSLRDIQRTPTVKGPSIGRFSVQFHIFRMDNITALLTLEEVKTLDSGLCEPFLLAAICILVRSIIEPIIASLFHHLRAIFHFHCNFSCLSLQLFPLHIPRGSLAAAWVHWGMTGRLNFWLFPTPASGFALGWSGNQQRLILCSPGTLCYPGIAFWNFSQE